MRFLTAAYVRAKCGLNSFLYDEKGDTNFISILVILAIVLALGAVFLTFKDSILKWVGEAIAPFFSQGSDIDGNMPYPSGVARP